MVTCALQISIFIRANIKIFKIFAVSKPMCYFKLYYKFHLNIPVEIKLSRMRYER